MTLPKTIDNDVAMTDITFGFDTAMNIATEAIDRLHTAATSHHRGFAARASSARAWVLSATGRSSRPVTGPQVQIWHIVRKRTEDAPDGAGLTRPPRRGNRDGTQYRNPADP